MRVLLTGSAGWLGRHLAPLLGAEGHEVVGLDRAASPHTQVIGSVTDRGLLERLLTPGAFHAVIHAAALHKPDIARHAAGAFVDVNVTGTLNLLEAASSTGVGRFVFTSTTSLMITEEIRAGRSPAAAWLDERTGPLEPRNIYGATKLAAESLCRVHHLRHGLPCIVLRTARFFPEDDDSEASLTGENLKANEFLHRRLTAEDAAHAHLAALDRAPALGFGVFVVSAQTPFARSDAKALMQDAASVVARHFPDAPALYAARGWRLPPRIDRVYDATAAERALGFRCRTDFATILQALREGAPLPFAHDPTYVSPGVRGNDIAPPPIA
jgi:nucleoside-diphosphate-sugar epimerase